MVIYLNDLFVEKKNVTFDSRGDLKGCEYNGAMTQGRMHGKGRLESPDGSVYTGSWRNDVKHGWGEFKLSTGIVRVSLSKVLILNSEATLKFKIKL